MDRFWPERIALFIGIAIFAVLFLIGSGAPQAGTDAWADAFLAILGTIALKVLFPLWIVLRAFNALFITPRRNRF